MDFDKCFELLASRPTHAHAHCESAHHSEGRADADALADVLQSRFGPGQDGSSSSSAQQRSSVTPDAIDREEQSYEQLSALALAQSFFKMQEARVQIYSDFQKGFDVHQKTALFPEFSSGITARFSAVSTQINNIEEVLIKKQKPVLAQYIRKIQLEEKEKLLMTSALLVEKMRLRDAENQSEPDESITFLLEKSIGTLSSKHAAIIQRINELLDELRSEITDLDDENGE